MAFVLAYRSASPGKDLARRQIIEARDADTFSDHERDLFMVVERQEPSSDFPAGLGLNVDDIYGDVIP